MVFLNNGKLMMIGGTAKYYILLDNFCLKWPLVFKFPLGMFLTQETQKWHWSFSKTYRQMLPKFTRQHISVNKKKQKKKNKTWYYSWVNFFFNRIFLNTKNMIWWENELQFFLGSFTILNWLQTIFHNQFY